MDLSGQNRKSRKKIKKWPIITAVILAVICTLLYFALNNKLTLTKYTFASERLPESFEGYKILAVCDLHSQEFGESQSALIKSIRSANPDLIVLLGDIIDASDTLFKPLEELLSGLNGDYMTYAISGNHEKALSFSEMQKLYKLYATYGVALLEDDGVAIYADKIAFSYGKIARAYNKVAVSAQEIAVYTGKSERFIMLWGGEDPPVWNDSAINYIAENGLNVSPLPENFNIFLYHRANLFPEVYKYGFDLMLSAHLHGGQVRLPFIGGLISPTRKWFPDYTAGIYTKTNKYANDAFPEVSTMIVGRGLGNTADIPRIFNPPEIFTVTLKVRK